MLTCTIENLAEHGDDVSKFNPDFGWMLFHSSHPSYNGREYSVLFTERNMLASLHNNKTYDDARREMCRKAVNTAAYKMAIAELRSKWRKLCESNNWHTKHGDTLNTFTEASSLNDLQTKLDKKYLGHGLDVYKMKIEEI